MNTISKFKNEWQNKFGIRYIPQLNFDYKIDRDGLLNIELMLNTNYVTDLHSNELTLRLYRAILRYSTELTETQIGLQKINFGSAQLLRPLMWFDRIDPSDPVKFTSGVYGIRFKYNFQNNSTLWIWSLLWNNETKGIDILPSVRNIPEFGGRLQIPFFSGEIATSFHTRKVNALFTNYRENRFALDSRWDFGFGLWFESVVQNNISELINYKYSRFLTIGTDYTIPIENGIYVIAEHSFSTLSKSFSTSDLNRNISAVMFSYSFGIFDSISLLEYYYWFNNALFHHLQFQRTYDNFIINLSLFRYPEINELAFLNNFANIIPGFGLQFTFIFNY